MNTEKFAVIGKHAIKRHYQKDYNNYKRKWLEIFRMYKLIFLHIIGTSTIIVSFIAMIDTIKYFLGY